MAWMTVWITNYALTKGIIETDGDVKGDSKNMARVRMPWSNIPSYVSGKDLHLTEASAIARAEEMRDASIAAADRRLKKLKAMKFGGGDE